MKGLYERGWMREDVIKLFRFIDWLMVLPAELTQAFKIAAREYEEEKKMQYISSLEQLAIAEGSLKTQREDVVKVLNLRFGNITDSIVEQLDGIEDVTVLESLLEKAVTTVSLEEFQQFLPSVAEPTEEA